MDKSARSFQHGTILPFVIILVLVLLGGGVFWFMFRNNPQSLPKPVSESSPLEKLTVGNVVEHSIFNTVAKEKGFFKNNGLDVTIIKYDSGAASTTALLEGKVDVALAADFGVVRTIFTSQGLKILAEANKSKIYQIIARKDKGITKPSDLEDKKIGVTRKNVGEFYFGVFLTLNNLDLNDVEIVDLPPTEMVKQLEEGKIDGAVLFDPYAYHLKKKLGDSLINWSAQGEQNTFGLLVSTDSFIKSHPETINKYLQSQIEAERYTKEHPDEIQTLIATTFGYEKDYVVNLWQHLDLGHRLDQELLLVMEGQARWAIDNKLVGTNLQSSTASSDLKLIDQTRVPNYLDYIYFEGLEKVSPDRITIVH